MKIGILITGHLPDEMKPDYGTYAPMFETLLDGQGFTFQSWSVVDMQFPTDVDQADGWLITGSRHGAYEEHAFIPPLEEFIRAAYATDVPMVGVCFGHQIIAQALGGKVIKYPEGWAVGRQEYEYDGKKVYLNAWHQDQVVTRPDDATVLAGNDFCENAVLLYGEKAFTIQPHPEFKGTFVNGLLTHRANGVVPPDLIKNAQDHLDDPIDDNAVAQSITRFFKTRQVK